MTSKRILCALFLIAVSGSACAPTQQDGPLYRTPETSKSVECEPGHSSNDACATPSQLAPNALAVQRLLETVATEPGEAPPSAAEAVEAEPAPIVPTASDAAMATPTGLAPPRREDCERPPKLKLEAELTRGVVFRKGEPVDVTLKLSVIGEASPQEPMALLGTNAHLQVFLADFVELTTLDDGGVTQTRRGFEAQLGQMRASERREFVLELRISPPLDKDSAQLYRLALSYLDPQNDCVMSTGISAQQRFQRNPQPAEDSKR
ncbi:MAG: hypothetical protein RBU37_15215 [Myxococcota bacterium]|jgi:hypothetical protein|nr:hypothetical protein [Myxococcota bacterium]